jgi:YVTN family beta-propeller protein
MRSTTSAISRIGFVVFIALLTTSCVRADKVRVMVLNNHGTTLDMIDPSTNEVVQTIQNIPHSHGITFSHDGHHGYVTSESVDVLYDVDLVSGKILRQLPMSKGSANLPALTGDESQLFVCINGGRDEHGNMMSGEHGVLDIVDVKTFTITKSIDMPGGMHDCYTTPDQKYIVASSLGGKFLSVLDPKTAAILWTVKFDRGVATSAFEVAKDGSTSRIFSALANGFHGFAVIDFAQHKEVARIAMPKPDDFRLEGELVRRNDQPTHGSGIPADGKTLWMATHYSNGTYVFSLPDLKLIKHLPAPLDTSKAHPLDDADPSWICFTPDGKFAYVANSEIDKVSVFDTKTFKQVALVPVGRQPDHVETVVIRGE